jgi:hypothetical protein
LETNLRILRKPINYFSLAQTCLTQSTLATLIDLLLLDLLLSAHLVLKGVDNISPSQINNSSASCICGNWHLNSSNCSHEASTAARPTHCTNNSQTPLFSRAFTTLAGDGITQPCKMSGNGTTCDGVVPSNFLSKAT